VPIAEPLVHLGPDDLAATMAEDVRAGLSALPKVLPPKYFYDARGSDLFEQITRLPEYYPTRTETAILQRRVGEITRLTGARTLVELGSGTSEKTRLLLHALLDAATLRRFVPLDVDPTVLALAGKAIAAEFPGLEVQPVVADFEQHLPALPHYPRRLLAFLGSTIGNLEPAQRGRFLRGVRATLDDGDAFLLGVDLVKDERRLVSAYDDAAGVTAAFDANMLAVLNRELDADFDLAGFAHRAVWDAGREWIEMRLVARHAQRVHVRALDLVADFADGEAMRTEVSAKFRREGIEGELQAAGLAPVRWWTDPAGDFALSLSRPATAGER
jgi:L-histidine N-alpha-methyltransferase